MSEVTNTKDEHIQNLMADAVEEYAEVVAPNLRIMAASEQPTINDVKAAAYHIADQRGKAKDPRGQQRKKNLQDQRHLRFPPAHPLPLLIRISISPCCAML